MEHISVIQRLDNNEQPAKGKIMSPIRIAIVIALATAIAFAFACGGAGESLDYGYQGESGRPGAPGATGSPDGFDGVVETEVVERLVEVEVEVEKEVMAEFAAEKVVAAAAAAPTAAPAMAMEMSDEQLAQNVEISIQPQNRIIVRNADMSVESNTPAATIDAISDLAVGRGGWVVNSNTIEEGSYYHITIRIPAETLDAVIDEIAASVEKVLSSQSDSTDFTEEYIDLGARRSTVQNTVDALSELLKSEKYDSVNELLEVQREITNWQSELERIDGRMAFISESAAFSRLTVIVNRSPIPMKVDVGEDVNVGIGVGRKYTARFFPARGLRPVRDRLGLW